MIFAKKYDVYLGTRAFVVCRESERLVARQVADYEEALVELCTWLKSMSGSARLRIWLSGGLCRPFLMPPLAGVRGASETRRVAALLAPRHTGLEGECEAWVEKASHVGARIVVVVQRNCLDLLLRASGETRGRSRIVSIRPWWSAVLRDVVKRDAHTSVVAAQDCDSLTFFAGQEAFSVASTVTPLVGLEAADAAFTRLSLSAVDASDGPKRHARLLPMSEPSSQRAGFAFEPFVHWAA